MNKRSNSHPPQCFLQIVGWFCPDDLVEEIEGDLIQKYSGDLEKYGERRARRRFIWNTIRFFRPGIILRNRFSFQLINTIMLQNYLTIALRTLAKNKVFSAINIFGLGIGLAACLLIFQFVSFELSYDKFNDKFDRIYRVTNDRFQNGKLIQHGTITYPTIGPAMTRDFPEIEMYTRLMPGGDLLVKVEDRNFRGDNCLFSDEHFFSVFSFPLLAGDRKTALKDPNSIVLTEELAKKYYGNGGGDFSALIGKTLYYGSSTDPFKVTGICRNVPDNSHLQFDALVSYSTLFGNYPDADDSWRWSDFRHYIVLKPGVDKKVLESKFEAFSERHFQGDKVSGSVEKFFLQPLSDAHLYSDYEYDVAKTASGRAVWAMLIVALFILVIAWINYINLTTSRALDRAKEVGLRKVMGAARVQLVKQFIFESILISIAAIILAAIIIAISQTSFNSIIRSKVTVFSVFSGLNTGSIGLFLLVLLAGILLSGFYPAFVLSSYQPVTVLKGKFQRSSKGQFLRKSLVVFQFTASAALITGTLIVSKQLKFMNQADLGMNINNILVIRPPSLTGFDSTYIERVESFKAELEQIPGVIATATSGRLPGDRLGRGFDFRLSDQAETTRYTMSFFGIDYNFFETYGISILSGRGFLATDHNADFGKINSVIINQNAVHLLGIANAEEAIGKEIITGKNLWRIVGVVNDFHQESLKKAKEPTIFVPLYSTDGPTSVRFRGNEAQQLIAESETLYKKFFPHNAFSFVFLEDAYNAQYNDEKRFSKVTVIFTVLGIIISCLGLIALSGYTAVQRTKEIGIRKALGASMNNIIALLSSEFLRLIVISIILALPVAYYFMAGWLANYPYRISLEWFLFVVPAVVILLIAFLTMSFQIIRTARTNPANTLKYE